MASCFSRSLCRCKWRLAASHTPVAGPQVQHTSAVGTLHRQELTPLLASGQPTAAGMSDPGQQWNFTAEHQQRFLQQQMAFQQQQAMLQQRAQHRQLPPQAVASQQAPAASFPGPSSMGPPASSQMVHQLPGSAGPSASSTPGALPAPGGLQQQQQESLSGPAAPAPGMPATGAPASVPPLQLGQPSAGASSGFKVLLSRPPSSPSPPLPATQAHSGQPPLLAPPARPSMQAPAHLQQTVPTVAQGSGSGTQQQPPPSQQQPHNLLRQQSGGTSEQSSDRQSGRSAQAPSAPNAWQNGSTSGLGRSSSSIASKTAPGAVVWAKLQRYPWWPAQVRRKAHCTAWSSCFEAVHTRGQLLRQKQRVLHQWVHYLSGLGQQCCSDVHALIDACAAGAGRAGSFYS